MNAADRKKFRRLIDSCGTQDVLAELEFYLLGRLDGTKVRERVYKALQSARRVYIDDLHDVSSIAFSHPNQSVETR